MKRKRLTLPVLMALLPAILFVGCESLQNAYDDPVGRVMINTAIRVVAYKAASNNPELEPVIRDVATLMTSLSPIFQPDEVKGVLSARADEILSKNNVSAQDRLIVELMIDDVISIYAQAYAAYQDDPLVNEEMAVLLAELRTAIEQGLALVGTDFDANAPVEPIVLRKVFVQLE